MTHSQNDKNLESAIAAWLQGSLEIISSKSANLFQKIDGWESWQVASEGGFTRNPYTIVYNNRNLEKEIFENNIYWTSVETAIEEHANFKKHISSGLIGSAYGTSRWGPTSRQICEKLLPRPNREGISTSANGIEASIRALLSEINSDKITTTTVWPIANIQVSAPVRLDSRTEFRELTDSEKIIALQFGIIRGFVADRIDPESSHWYGLVLKEIDHKTFGDALELPPDYILQWSLKEQVLENFLALIPIACNKVAFHAGGHSSAPSFQFGGSLSIGVSGLGVQTSTFRFFNSGENSNLSHNETLELVSLWSTMGVPSAGKFQKRVANAARRLFYAQTRANPEDMLIDCMIAAESLYLDDDNKNELSYRLSLNAALWSEEKVTGQRDVFNLFKKAYALWGKIVHGGTVNREEVGHIIEEVKKVIRNGITKAFRHLQTSQNPPDWNSFIFRDRRVT